MPTFKNTQMTSNCTQETSATQTAVDTDCHNHECKELPPTPQQHPEINLGEDQDISQIDFSQDQEIHMSFMSTNEDNPTTDPPTEPNDNKETQHNSQCQKPQLQPTTMHQIYMRYSMTTTQQMTPKVTLKTKPSTAFEFLVQTHVG